MFYFYWTQPKSNGWIHLFPRGFCAQRQSLKWENTNFSYLFRGFRCCCCCSFFKLSLKSLYRIEMIDFKWHFQTTHFVYIKFLIRASRRMHIKIRQPICWKKKRISFQPKPFSQTADSKNNNQNERSFVFTYTIKWDTVCICFWARPPSQRKTKSFFLFSIHLLYYFIPLESINIALAKVQ